MTRANWFVAGALILAISPVATVNGSQARGQQPPPAQKTTPDPDDDFAKGSYEPGTPGLIAPQIIRSVMPKYTPEAMRQKLQGTVEVEIIIGTDGSVAKARVKKSLDKVLGLDDAAIAAAKDWKFSAGTLNGQPVPVHGILNLEFRLH